MPASRPSSPKRTAAQEVELAVRLAVTLNRQFAFRFEGWTRDQREDFALRCIRHAATRGLLKEGEIIVYAGLAAYLGIDFESHPAASASGLTPHPGEGYVATWLYRTRHRLERMLRDTPSAQA